jgi:hypothetical protein
MAIIWFDRLSPRLEWACLCASSRLSISHPFFQIKTKLLDAKKCGQ